MSGAGVLDSEGLAVMDTLELSLSLPLDPCPLIPALPAVPLLFPPCTLRRHLLLECASMGCRSSRPPKPRRPPTLSAYCATRVTLEGGTMPGCSAKAACSAAAVAACCASVRTAAMGSRKETRRMGSEILVWVGVGVGVLLAPRLRVVEGVREKLEEEELLRKSVWLGVRVAEAEAGKK